LQSNPQRQGGLDAPSNRSVVIAADASPTEISEFAAVIGPMQQGLPLTLAAEEISSLAVFLWLTDVAADRGPAFDLSCIFVRKPPSPIIAAVPLKPAARVLRMDPALLAPHRERLAGRNAEEIHLGVRAFRREFGLREPARRKLVAAVGHVFSAEDSKAQHFRRRKIGIKVRVKAAAGRGDENVAITAR
jgi:hypothetical protein